MTKKLSDRPARYDDDGFFPPEKKEDGRWCDADEVMTILDAKDQQLTDLRSTMHVELVQKDAEIEQLRISERKDLASIHAQRVELDENATRIAQLEEAVEAVRRLKYNGIPITEMDSVLRDTIAKLDKAND